MRITIEAPDQKGSSAELWEVHRKVGLFLKKNHLKALEVYQPTHTGNTMVFEIKQSEHGDLVLDEIKSLLSSKTMWKIKENHAKNH